MNLAVDIGNTQVKFGIFENDELKEVFSQEESIEQILSIFKIENAIISKTGSSNIIGQKLDQRKEVKTLLLSSELKLPIRILYETPQALGADRIAGCVAANFLFQHYAVFFFFHFLVLHLQVMILIY